MEDLAEEGEVVGGGGIVDEHDSAWLLEQNAWLMEELEAKDGECLSRWALVVDGGGPGDWGRLARLLSTAGVVGGGSKGLLVLVVI